MTTFLPLLLILGLANDLALSEHNSCSTDIRLNESDVSTIKTSSSVQHDKRITVTMAVYPDKDFSGVSLEAVTGKEAPYKAWFPIPGSFNDTCWQQQSGWRELAGEVHVFEGNAKHDINFWLNIGKCLQGCTRKDATDTMSLQSLTMVGHGASNWTSHCSAAQPTTFTQEQYKNKLLSCTDPPPPTSLTQRTTHPPPQPSPLTTAHSLPPTVITSKPEGGTSVTVLVAVGLLVGVVAVVLTVVVTVAIVCLVRRRRRGLAARRLRWMIEAAQPAHHAHQPLGHHAAHQDTMYVSENSLYEPSTGPTTTQ